MSAVKQEKVDDKSTKKKLTNRQIREREFISLTRKLKPHLSKLIAETFRISQDPNAKDTDKIKAAIFLSDLFKESLKQSYDVKYDEQEGTEPQPLSPKAPVFSLTMVKNGNIVSES